MKIQELSAKLSTSSDKQDVEHLLRETVHELLHHYKVNVQGIELFPIELESYFYREEVFEDPYVHSNELQKNHFGELYVHRRGRRADDAYKMDNRVCVGISLSENNDYYYSALIRSAVFSDGSMVFGPNNVLTHLMEKVNKHTHTLNDAFFSIRHSGTFELSKMFPLIEHRQVLQHTDANADPRDKTYLIDSSRIGLGDLDSYFRHLPLRSITGKLTAEFAFKEKTLLKKNLQEVK